VIALPTESNGDARKDAAHALLEARRDQYVCLARRALLLHLLEHGTATIDDIRAVVELPDDINPKLFGAVPGALARAGIVRRVGFTMTARPAAHSRPISVWTLVDEEKAREWLAANPTLPMSAPGEQRLLSIVVEGRNDD
jgi:hypothetical protein